MTWVTDNPNIFDCGAYLKPFDMSQGAFAPFPVGNQAFLGYRVDDDGFVPLDLDEREGRAICDSLRRANGKPALLGLILHLYAMPRSVVTISPETEPSP